MTPRLVLKCLAGLAIALAGSGSFSAELYKWVDEKGVVTYGEKPPPNTRATPVNTQPGAVVETGEQGSPKATFDRRQAGEGSERPAVPAMSSASQGAPTASVRGMEFEVYIRLQPGMTEGELLQRAGRPDHESVENLRRSIVKTYYYFPTTSNPYTTVVTLRGGRIQQVDRVKKF